MPRFWFDSRVAHIQTTFLPWTGIGTFLTCGLRVAHKEQVSFGFSWPEIPDKMAEFEPAQRYAAFSTLPISQRSLKAWFKALF